MLLSSDLFTAIRKDILEMKYERGYKLTEQNICTQYNVSRTPVREALRQLEAEGLIETVPNRGAYVLGLDEQDIKDIFELRKAYEILAVKWAIERISDDELEDLEEAYEFMEFYTKKNDLEKMVNINSNFHQIIYKAAHNRIILSTLLSYQQYTEYIKIRRSYEKDYLHKLLLEHTEIFKAFKDSDVERGVRAMEKHMDNSIERCYNIIDRRLSWNYSE